MNENKSEIIVYGTRWCYDSTRTRRWLDNHSVAYRYIDIDEDQAGRAIVEQINRGYRSVPTIVFPDGSTLTEPTSMALAEKIEAYTREQAQSD